MNKEEKKNYLIREIWELRVYMALWRYIFGNESSKEKVEEFASYFTNRVLHIFQESLQTKILIDLKTLIDKKRNVISIFDITSRNNLKKLDNVYSNLRAFTYNCISHKNEKHGNFKYRFVEVFDTIDELQRIIEENYKDEQFIWNAEGLVKNEFISLYEKVKRVNKSDKLNKTD